MNKTILVVGLIFTLLLISGCATKTNQETNITDIEPEICKLKIEYEHNMINPVNCECPEGYGFETVSMDWGPCPPDSGRSDCPASILKCSKQEST